jgi:hypothetical protein
MQTLEHILRVSFDEEQKAVWENQTVKTFSEPLCWDKLPDDTKTSLRLRFKHQLEMLGNPHLQLETYRDAIQAALIGLNAILASLLEVHSFSPENEYIQGARVWHQRNLIEAVRLLEASMAAQPKENGEPKEGTHHGDDGQQPELEARQEEKGVSFSDGESSDPKEAPVH